MNLPNYFANPYALWAATQNNPPPPGTSTFTFLGIEPKYLQPYYHGYDSLGTEFFLWWWDHQWLVSDTSTHVGTNQYLIPGPSYDGWPHTSGEQFITKPLLDQATNLVWSLPCAAGRFASATGSLSCTVCGLGSYAPTTGMSSCMPCPLGTYGPKTGLTVCTACAAGKYRDSTGNAACLACQLGVASVAGASFCSACVPGKYTTTAAVCAACAAGTFSYFQGATACQACPQGSGSDAGATICVSCSSSATCKTGAHSCVACSNACTACPAGQYNDGSASACSLCAAGKYSANVQATSVDTCALCDNGYTTLPAARGQTACTSCARLNQPMPNYAYQVNPAPDVLVCSWGCNSGYIRVSYSTSSFVASSFAGYNATQALQLFHILHDYCCDPTILSSPGMYLSGCSRSTDGVAARCPAVANGLFVMSPTPKLSGCLDFVCNEWYVSTGTACIAQPSCQANYTYQRDASGSIVTTGGLFACVPCSRCMNGAGVLAPCNKTADTRCALCPPNTFSFSGSGCVNPVPLGYMGVVVQLTAMPAYQGRADVMADGVTPVQWGNILIYTFTPCQPIPSSSVFIGQDVPCRRLDTQQALCQLPSCNTQCRPWNGTAGWFNLRGQCSPCLYDSFCGLNEYSDMSVCGPALSPVCRPCPSIPLPNAVGWVNPGRYVQGAKYPCAVVCKDGFVLDANSSCVLCPSLPNNSKVKTGCDWECSLGYTQVGPSSCVPCAGVPTACNTGYYVGYGTGQCAYCLPCTNVVANSRYISPGVANGPNSCGLLCNPGYFADPAFGFDVFGNPVACTRCTQPQCIRGVSFAVQCAYTADAYCERCSDCPIGYTVSRACTLGANTTCVQCGGLPAGAVWTAPGCVEWDCGPGYYRGDTECVECKKPANCSKSDSYSYVANKPGCGVCTPCNASLLLPFQCFNGDGQCGTTYWCGWTSSSAAQTTSVAGITTTTTTTPSPSTPVQNYATLMTVTLSAAQSVSDFTRYVLCPQCSSVRVLSVTRGNVTTYCSSGGCRRLLAETIVIEVGIISQAPVAPTIDSAANPSAVSVSASHAVPDATDISSPEQFRSFIQTMESRPDQPLSSSLWILLVIAAAWIASVTLMILCCGFEYRRMLRRPAVRRELILPAAMRC